MNKNDHGDKVQLPRLELTKVTEFEYLTSIALGNGEHDRDVKRSVLPGWKGWRRVTGII